MSAGAAAAAAAIAQAIKASGVLVRVTPEDFVQILGKTEKPLVISATGGIIRTNYQYLTSYKGFAFHTKCPVPLEFSFKTEVVAAQKIWIPG